MSLHAARTTSSSVQRAVGMEATRWVMTTHTFSGLNAYLVGGAVRDMLLGRAPKDRDFVVLGATPEHMLALGFEQVGASFPVYRHPSTGDEWALARSERSNGASYKDFEVTTAGVSLRDDLARRDLTLNAMAMRVDGTTLVDPFGGRADLEAGVLRHVSSAFAEDPVRVLRVARFAARYGFTVAPETLELMRAMVSDGLLDHLVPERVGLELMKAMGEAHPSMFFRVLAQVGGLDVVFPELGALQGVLQPVKHHPEGDAFEHTMLVLEQAALATEDVVTRFAALVHDLGKGETPRELWPKHHKHEEAGVPLVDRLCERARLPNAWARAGRQAARYHTRVHRLLDARRAGPLEKMMRELRVAHTLEHVERLAVVARSDARGRTGMESLDYPQGDRLLELASGMRSVNVKAAVARALARGNCPKQAASQARCQHLACLLGGHNA